MSTPPLRQGSPAQTRTPSARSLSLRELGMLLEELDRVVGELEESLTEFALPFDQASRGVAVDAIVAARRSA